MKIFAFLTFFGFAVSTALITNADPAAVVKEKDLDFGKIEQGKSETKKITIQNTGDSKLEIVKLESNSSALTPTMETETIDPQGEEEIEIKLDTAGISPCRMVKYIYIETKNSSEGKSNKTIAITCSATVVPVNKPMVQFTPFEIDLGIVYPGEKVTKKVTYQNVGTADLDIEPIQYLDNRFELVENLTERTLEVGKQGQFSISFEAKIPGRIESYVLVKSNTEGGPYTKIAVKGVVAEKGLSISEIEPIPAREDAEEGQETKYKIKLGNYSLPYEMKVTLLEAQKKRTEHVIQAGKSKVVTVEIKPDNKGKVISLRVDIIIEKPEPVIIKKPDEKNESVEEEASAETDEDAAKEPEEANEIEQNTVDEEETTDGNDEE